MSIKYLSAPATVLITPALASEFQSMTSCPRERPLLKSRLDRLREEGEVGIFHAMVWSSVHCLETKTTYRINGHHTSTVLASWVGALPRAYATVERWQCDTLKEVAKLWSQRDQSESVRSKSDVNLAYAGSVPELANIPKHTVNLVVSAVALADFGFRSRSGGAGSRAERIVDKNVINFTIWFDAIVGSCVDGRYLKRVPVVRAMYVTYNKSANDADVFWKEVRDASNPDNESPSRKLNKFLMQTTLGSVASKTGGMTKAATEKEFTSKCITAWNAFRQDTPTNLRYYNDKPVPSPV